MVGGYGSVIPWLWQGLEGAPRRFAVLPDQYLDDEPGSRCRSSRMIVVGQALFGYNLLRTLGRPWLAEAVGPPPAEQAPAAVAVARERPRDVLAGLLVGGGVALAIPALWLNPFLWAPLGLLAGYVAVTLGARRNGRLGDADRGPAAGGGVILQL